MYDVQVFVDRVLLAECAADEMEPADCLRMKPSSLRKLAALRPEYVVPSPLPVSHRDVDASERRRQDDHTAHAVNGDDLLPPIPAGFQQIEWQNGSSLHHFMVWSRVEGAQPK